MAEEKKVDEVMTVQFTRGELLQLHLCVVCRSAVATALWTNATDQKSQATYQGEINFLTDLTAKIAKELSK